MTRTNLNNHRAELILRALRHIEDELPCDPDTGFVEEFIDQLFAFGETAAELAISTESMDATSSSRDGSRVVHGPGRRRPAGPCEARDDGDLRGATARGRAARRRPRLGRDKPAGTCVSQDHGVAPRARHVPRSPPVSDHDNMN